MSLPPLVSVDERVAASLERIATALEIGLSFKVDELTVSDPEELKRSLLETVEAAANGWGTGKSSPQEPVPLITYDAKDKHAAEKAISAIQAWRAANPPLPQMSSVPFKWRCGKCTAWVMENEVHGCSVA